MLNKDKIRTLAETVDIDYGDQITKRELTTLFEIDQSYKVSDITISEYEKASEQSQWEFFAVMEVFKTFLRELRCMHLEAAKERFCYKVIRPEQHVDVALGHLRKQIEKGFSKAHQILDSTAENLLDSAEKLALSNAQIRVSRLEGMVQNAQKKVGVFERFKALDKPVD